MAITGVKILFNKNDKYIPEVLGSAIVILGGPPLSRD